MVNPNWGKGQRKRLVCPYCGLNMTSGNPGKRKGLYIVYQTTSEVLILKCWNRRCKKEIKYKVSDVYNLE